MVMLLILVLTLTTIFSFAQMDIPPIDPNKFTICAITINSENERAVFEQQVKKYPDKFNPIVELTNFGEEDWFNKACESNIKCDQLVVSGHFAGSFFSEDTKNGKNLPLSSLEEKGCAKSCQGILDQPYEVFLFGCNTLSTKEKDSRSPEEYYKVLKKDGFSDSEAERIVEDRYGPTGEDNISKMQRAFTGHNKNLFGFNSIGPRGAHVEGFLKKYFSKINPHEHLEKLQAKRMINQVHEANVVLTENLKHSAFTQCLAGSSNGNKNVQIICSLLDEKKSVDSKIEVMVEALAEENYLNYIYAINQFVKNNPVDSMTPNQKAQFAVLSKNLIIKNQMNNMVTKTKSLTLLLEWLSFSSHFNYIDEKIESKLLSELITNMFKKGLSFTDKELLCSLDTKFKDKFAPLASDFTKLELKPDDFVGLACLYPNNKEIQLKLLEGIKEQDQYVRYMVIVNFMLIKPQDKEVQLKLLEAFEGADENVRAWISDVFGAIKPQDKEIQLKLLSGLKDNNPSIRSAVINAFADIRTQDKGIQLLLLDALNDEDESVRGAVEAAFIEIKPTDSEIKLQLKK